MAVNKYSIDPPIGGESRGIFGFDFLKEEIRDNFILRKNPDIVSI
jgi:hypothetical protein